MTRWLLLPGMLTLKIFLRVRVRVIVRPQESESESKSKNSKSQAKSQSTFFIVLFLLILMNNMQVKFDAEGAAKIFVLQTTFYVRKATFCPIHSSL